MIPALLWPVGIRDFCLSRLHDLLGRPIEGHAEVLSYWPLVENKACLLSWRLKMETEMETGSHCSLMPKALGVSERPG